MSAETASLVLRALQIRAGRTVDVAEQFGVMPPSGLRLYTFQIQDGGIDVLQLPPQLLQYPAEVHTRSHPQFENSISRHRLQSGIPWGIYLNRLDRWPAE